MHTLTSFQYLLRRYSGPSILVVENKRIKIFLRRDGFFVQDLRLAIRSLLEFGLLTEAININRLWVSGWSVERPVAQLENMSEEELNAIAHSFHIVKYEVSEYFLNICILMISQPTIENERNQSPNQVLAEERRREIVWRDDPEDLDDARTEVKIEDEDEGILQQVRKRNLSRDVLIVSRRGAESQSPPLKMQTLGRLKSRWRMEWRGALRSR